MNYHWPTEIVPVYGVQAEAWVIGVAEIPINALGHFDIAAC